MKEKYSCKKATEMVEKKSFIGLSSGENIKLKLHLLVCKACRSYNKHSKLIDIFFQNTNQNETIEVFKNDELKQAIISKIKE